MIVVAHPFLTFNDIIRSAEEADAQSLRAAVLLDELDFPGILQSATFLQIMHDIVAPWFDFQILLWEDRMHFTRPTINQHMEE